MRKIAGVAGWRIVVIAALAALAPGCARQMQSRGVRPAGAVAVEAAPTHVTNFGRVSPGIFRGAATDREGFEELRRLGVKTVVDLRAMHDDRHDLRGLGLRYVSIPSFPWRPREEDIARVLRVIAEPANQPVFIHCAQGCDRTGCAVAVYRMVEQAWTLQRAEEEMRAFHFHPVWLPISSYLENFKLEQFRLVLEAAVVPVVEKIP
ncbi:MAG TPA: tyrosine-protein phosphatase [Tepidisphaeraceae bacterium]